MVKAVTFGWNSGLEALAHGCKAVGGRRQQSAGLPVTPGEGGGWSGVEGLPLALSRAPHETTAFISGGFCPLGPPFLRRSPVAYPTVCCRLPWVAQTHTSGHSTFTNAPENRGTKKHFFLARNRKFPKILCFRAKAKGANVPPFSLCCVRPSVAVHLARDATFRQTWMCGQLIFQQNTVPHPILFAEKIKEGTGAMPLLVVCVCSVQNSHA